CIPVSAESEFDEKLIRDVTWPKNTLVVAIRRGETEYIPKGSSKILAGDVLVLLLPEKQADKLNETLFKMGTSH
ncbi:MAG: TrkA C-terminal domain-containing protein, partial [Cetobacterium sp.]